MIGGHVRDDRDIATVEPESGSQNAATRGFENGVLDGRILQHHLGAVWAAHVTLENLCTVDVDAVGRRHPDATSGHLQDVGDHPAGRRLAVRAGDGHDRECATASHAGTAGR